MSDRATKTVSITPAAAKAKRAYFAALWSLWRIYDLHGYELVGVHKSMEQVALKRMLQARAVLGHAIGGTSRRRDKNGRTVPSAYGRRVAEAILDFATKKTFTKKFGEARKAWMPPPTSRQACPVEWSEMSPELQKMALELEAISKAIKTAEAVMAWPCEHQEK